MVFDNAEKVARIVADECLAGRVRRLNRVITNLYDRALHPHGIKINQASILVLLLVHGETGPGEIGARLQMEKSTVSRNIDRMRRSGWLDVVGKGAGVGQTIRITPLGRQLMVDAHDQWQSAQSKARELVGEEGAQALSVLAERLRQS